MTAAIAVLTRSEARARTNAIRADLTAAVANLRAAVDLDVPGALGYPDPWSWAQHELGDLLRQLRLPRQVRLALVEAMPGMSVRDVADRLGVSVGTVHNDRAQLGRVTPIGPRRQPQAPTGRVWQQTAEWLARHPDGLTLIELAKVAGWSEGKSSGALTDVLRRGLAVRLEDRRAGQRIHVRTPPGGG